MEHWMDLQRGWQGELVGHVGDDLLDRIGADELSLKLAMRTQSFCSWCDVDHRKEDLIANGEGLIALVLVDILSLT